MLFKNTSIPSDLSRQVGSIFWDPVWGEIKVMTMLEMSEEQP